MTIPVSNIVNIIPSVVSTGGTSLQLNGVIVDQSPNIPQGGILPFASLSAVGAFFGTSSTQYSLASIYFAGYTNCTQYPSTLFFAPYNAAAVSAWVAGGSMAGVTLATVKAITGTLSVTIDGTAKSAASLNLSAATSFTNAATLIGTALTLSGGQVCTWDAVRSRFQITSGTTGASTSTITYVSGTAAASLMLTQATGATLSQGGDISTPTSVMNNVIANTQNWAGFMTSFEPDTATKILFAVWVQTQNKKYFYAAWDSDVLAATANASATFGSQAVAAQYEGVMPIGGETVAATAAGVSLATLVMNTAAFVLAVAGSIDFSRANARITSAFKSQAGFTPTATTSTGSTNLIGNGYNYYGSYATANQAFQFLYPGSVTGTWKWFDAYVDQIYYNSQFQLSLITLLTGIGSVPYNAPGRELIRAALKDPITSMLNFGAARAGVALSALQIAQVNTAAGLAIDSTLYAQGYYLQILDPTAQVRGNRGTPVINFFYTDGGAVQAITMASIDVM